MNPLGTILHEMGHIVVAEAIGYNTTLHYNKMNWSSSFKKQVLETYRNHKKEIEQKIPFDGDMEYYLNVKKFNKDLTFILIGGVTQTIIFGISGFLILMYRKKREIPIFNIIDWIFVFLTFLLSRQVFMIVLNFFNYFMGEDFFGDEVRIANHLGINETIILLFLGIISFLILFWVVFYYVPKKNRLEFIIAGIAGSVFGYHIYNNIIGPIILPS